MRDRLVIIDAIKEGTAHPVNNSRCATSFCCRCSRVHKGSRKSTQKVQSHGSGRPTQLSRPSWFPLSRGYCFSWCAKQKRHQRPNARSYAQEVGESLRRVFGCHSVSVFRKKSPQRKIIVSSFSFKTIVIFSILLPN